MRPSTVKKSTRFILPQNIFSVDVFYPKITQKKCHKRKEIANNMQTIGDHRNYRSPSSTHVIGLTGHSKQK